MRMIKPIYISKGMCYAVNMSRKSNFEKVAPVDKAFSLFGVKGLGIVKAYLQYTCLYTLELLGWRLMSYASTGFWELSIGKKEKV